MNKYYEDDFDKQDSNGESDETFEETDEVLEFEEYRKECSKIMAGLNKAENSEDDEFEDEEFSEEEEDEYPSSEDEESEDDLTAFLEEKTVLKSKKFVIQIYPDNVEYIEDLDPEDRNDFINELITESIHKSYEDQETKRVSYSIKQIIVVLLTIIIGMPIVFYLINISLTATSDNYKQVQVNFEKLYRDRGRH